MSVGKKAQRRSEGSSLIEVKKTNSNSFVQVDPLKVYNRFSSLTSNKCKNTCNTSENSLCQTRAFEEWNNLIRDGIVRGVTLCGDKEYIFPLELGSRKFPPLTELKRLPNVDKSVIYHVDSRGIARKVNSVTCDYLGTLTFRVDFVDGYGRLRKHGGDSDRVWIKGNPTDKNLEDFSYAGRIHDLRNGSYLANDTCSWTGFAKVTLCQSHPNLLGRPCLCNFTEWNQVSFFCGKPLDSRFQKTITEALQSSQQKDFMGLSVQSSIFQQR